ncbi:RHS repeat-associated core domain-containing protein [Pseudomonas putida]|uniref:RHS repeat-associated core domain-containing protein n=1 Tax=Pseudomonas putida TaxID=303 RepID=UPI0027474C72|nr:RHS repeat-associated core domain-containing protein [Pseudomonas putida]MDP9523918.1 RHS repeat-associated core domain-containing protein [Pseudomonas putida]
MNDEYLKTQQAPTKKSFFYQNGKVALIKQPNKSMTIFRTKNLLLSERDTALSSSRTTLLETDHHASLLRAHAGAWIQAHVYTAYGYTATQPSAYSATGYNGERIDNDSVYLLGNGYRAYSPILSRFQTPDSLSPFGKGGINAYAYCSGDPINFTDPTGHWNVRQYIAKRQQRTRLKASGLTYDDVSKITQSRNPSPSNNSEYISDLQGIPYTEVSEKQLTLLASGLDKATEIANSYFASPEATEQNLELFKYLSDQKGLINTAKAYGHHGGRIVVNSPDEAASFFADKLRDYAKMLKANKKNWIPEISTEVKTIRK